MKHNSVSIPNTTHYYKGDKTYEMFYQVRSAHRC